MLAGLGTAGATGDINIRYRLAVTVSQKTDRMKSQERQSRENQTNSCLGEGEKRLSLILEIRPLFPCQRARIPLLFTCVTW